MRAQPRKIGLIFGILLGGVHLLWSILVLLGAGQWLIDFILWAHMFHMTVVVGPFDWTAAITLIIVTFIVGYVLGYVGAHIWNRIHR